MNPPRGAAAELGLPAAADQPPAHELPLDAPAIVRPPTPARPEVRGKFLWAGDMKLYLRGITYGTFAPGPDGHQYPEPRLLHRDFAAMAANGLNCVRVYTVPPGHVLDAAHRHGLRMLVGLPWEQHVAFLDDARRRRSIEERVAAGVRACAGHPALLGFSIGNEIPASIVRWHGRRRVERFLQRLYAAGKTQDPDALFTYVNFPSTEYLDTGFVDFACFNVYLEQRERLAAYLARLHNVVGERPLVMAEIGLDSRRNGEAEQADVLEWQVDTCFSSGCAGAFLFAWTDEWHRGGADIDDWDFGLTDRRRRPKPALRAVRRAFARAPGVGNHPLPRVSVVVCSCNGARTIRDCLDGLLAIDYPHYEVIVVDDGSTDDTAAIAAEYPFRLIRTPNRGLSSARNTGLEAATGELIAYIDDDARPDPHWLGYLAETFRTSDHAGVGGPNIAPGDDGAIAKCVAAAPGGPAHVLITDTVAEHIPGCNMAFRRESLLAIGGFDPQFRAAGDDVDVCWRLQERGWTLGFNPAAMVWHHRRGSLRAYWRQQRGYGRAEALLERKWPAKYNAGGHLSWQGRLYGNGLTQVLLRGRRRVHYGTWGTGLFQRMYQGTPSSLAGLALMPECYLLVAALAVVALTGVLWSPLLFALPLLAALSGVLVLQAVLSGVRATFPGKPESTRRRLALRLLTAGLHLVQPLARLDGRLAHGLTIWRRRGVPRRVLPVRRTLTFWSERWRPPEDHLVEVEQRLARWTAPAQRGGPWDRWDLQVRGGLLGGMRLLAAVEEHGFGRQLTRVRLWPRITVAAGMLVVTSAAIALAAALTGGMAATVVFMAGGSAVAVRTALECAAAAGTLVAAVTAWTEPAEASGAGAAESPAALATEASPG